MEKRSTREEKRVRELSRKNEIVSWNYDLKAKRWDDKPHRYKIISDPAKPVVNREKGTGGEPKTDMFSMICDLDTGYTDSLKTSFKGPNAEFVDNKLSLECCKCRGLIPTEGSLQGKNYVKSLLQETNAALEKNIARTLKKSKTLPVGYRLDVTKKAPKRRGTLTSSVPLPYDIACKCYSGEGSASYLCNARVNGKVVPGSGIAEFMCEESAYGKIKTAQEFFDNLALIEDYAKDHPVYLRTSAVNIRFNKDNKIKCEQRPLIAYAEYQPSDAGTKCSLVCEPYQKTSGEVVNEYNLEETLAADIRVSTTDQAGSVSRD